MALCAWYPLKSDMHNQGVGDANLSIRSTPTFSDGKIGGALSSGGSAYWTAEQTAKILNNQAVSICFWIYVNASAGTTTGGARIFGNDPMEANNNRKFTVFQYPNVNTLHLSWMNDAASTTYLGGVWDNVLPSYQWTHVAVTYQNPTCTIYINGERFTTVSGASNSTSFAYQTDVIIEDSKRKLCDFRVYNHCLSPREVKEISKGLVLHYTLAMPGGTNIVKQSSIWRSGSCASGITSSVLSDGTYQVVASSGNSNWNSSWFSTLDGIEDSFAEGDKFTISFTIKSDNNTKLPTIYIKSGMGYYSMIGKVSSQWSTIYYTGTWKKANTLAPHLGWGDIVGTYQFKNWKIEKGDHPTPWIPHVNDTEYTKMGFNNDIEYDVSGFCNNGTKTGTITYSSDTPKYWTSSCFNKSQYIKSSNEINTDDSTISLWIKADLSASYHILDCRNNSGVGKQPIYTYTNGSIQCGGNNQYVTSNAGLLVNDTWIHIVLVQSGNTLFIYKNGILFQTLDCPNSPIISSPVIGARYTYSNRYKGQLSDFRIYATCLSADDILELYNTPISLTSSGVLMTSGELTGV